MGLVRSMLFKHWYNHRLLHLVYVIEVSGFILIPFSDATEQFLNLALVQYLFTKGEYEVSVAPHGNSKRKDSYLRTMPSVMKKLKVESKHRTPKRALSFVSAQAGGIMEASSAGALPRNRQQVKDIRRANKQHEPDLTTSQASLDSIVVQSQGIG